MARKEKEYILGNIMKHPKLSKIMEDAFDAPVGSTKRAQALAVLKSIQNVKDKKYNNDGQGGPLGERQQFGFSGIPQGDSILNPNQNSYDKLMIFQAAPEGSAYDNLKFNAVTGEFYDPKDILKGYNAQKEKVSYTNYLKPGATGLSIGQYSPETRITPETIKKQKAGIGIGTSVPSQKYNIKIEPKELSIQEKIDKYLKGEKEETLFPKKKKKPKYFTGIPEDMWEEEPSALEELFSTKKPEAVKATVKPKWGPELEGYKVKGAQPQKGAVYGPPAPSDIKQEPEITPIQQASNEYYQMALAAGMSDSLARQMAEQAAGIAPSSEATAVPQQQAQGVEPGSDLEEIIKKAPGPESFYQAVTQLPMEEKRKLLDVPDDQMPMLTTQVRDLAEKESGLKEWRDKSLELQKQGQTLVPDLQEYIRGRDEYIKDIDKQIEEIKDQLIDSPNTFDDPKRRNHITYLEGLKARQAKTYTDYLNQSINDYNKKLNNVNFYFMKAKEDYARRYDELKENQVIAKTALLEKYNEIKKQNDPTVFWDIEKKALELQKAREEVANIPIEKAIKMSKELLSEINAIKDYLVDPKEGFLDPTVDLNEQYANLLGNLTISPTAISTVVTMGIDKMVNKYSQDFPELMKNVDNFAHQLVPLASNKQLNSSYEKGINGTMQKVNGQTYAGKLMKRLIEKSKSSIHDYLYSKNQKLKEAIEDLTPDDFWKYSSKSKDEWISKWEGSIDKIILNAMFDYYSREVQNNGIKGSRSAFTGFDKDGKPIMKVNEGMDTAIERIYNYMADSYLQPFGIFR